MGPSQSSSETGILLKCCLVEVFQRGVFSLAKCRSFVPENPLPATHPPTHPPIHSHATHTLTRSEPETLPTPNPVHRTLFTAWHPCTRYDIVVKSPKCTRGAPCPVSPRVPPARRGVPPGQGQRLLRGVPVLHQLRPEWRPQHHCPPPPARTAPKSWLGKYVSNHDNTCVNIIFYQLYTTQTIIYINKKYIHI